MKKDIYNVMKQLELKSSWDEFNFVQTLINQVNNDFWKQKQNIWFILSSACNDAAGEFYVKIREYVKNLTDIDVCNIHSLKSIAKSVDAEHLTNFIFQDYPNELTNLINIFSIKPSKLLEYGQQLHYSVMIPLYGNLDVRNCLVRSQKYSKSLILQIYNNIDKIEELLNFNNSPMNLNLRTVINTSKKYDLLDVMWEQNKKKYQNLNGSTPIVFLNNDTNQLDTFTYLPTKFYKLANDDKQEFLYNEDWTIAPWTYGIEYIKNKSVDNIYGYMYNSYMYNSQSNDNNYPIKYIDLQLIIDNIKNILYYKQQIDNSEKNLFQLNRMLNSTIYSDRDINYTIQSFIQDIFINASLVVQYDGVYFFNPFFALIECIKSLFYSRNSLQQFNDFYIEQDTGVKRELTELLKHIIETINTNDKSYIKHYMHYHFYNLFISNILNEQITNDFKFDSKNDKIKIDYVSKNSELTYEEFVSQISSYLSTKEIDQFLNNNVQICHYNRSYINFIKYLFIVNSINGYNDTKTEKLFPYLMYLYNNEIDKKDNFNSKFRELFGLDQNCEYTRKDYIQTVVNQFVDLCIKISYVREDLKALIQQYSFIGTQKIITNVLRDYFVKNFSKRSSWRYVSDLFKNKDHENVLKTIEELNGDIDKNSFQPSIIEYYDSTDYLNIITDLPSCVVKTNKIEVPINSSFITTQDIVSTYTLTADLVSTILDEFPFEIPEDIYPENEYLTSMIIEPVYLSGNTLSTTIVSSTFDKNVLCASFVTLTANFTNETLSTAVVKKENITIGSCKVTITYKDQNNNDKTFVENLQMFPYWNTTELHTITHQTNDLILYPSTKISLIIEPSNLITNIMFNTKVIINNNTTKDDIILSFECDGQTSIVDVPLSTIIKDRYFDNLGLKSNDSIKFEYDNVVNYRAPFYSQEQENYYYSMMGLSAIPSTVEIEIPITAYSISTYLDDKLNEPKFISQSSDIIISPSTEVSGGFWPQAILTSFIIPCGTIVSTYIPAGSFIVSTILSTGYEETVALCADFINEYNERFWQRDLNSLTYNELKKQISFYQNYFDELNAAQTKEQKAEIYKTKIYPLLTASWDAFATSGLLRNGLSSIHYQYSGKYPAKYPTLNIGNKQFTTIAPMPFIPNLIQTDVYDDDDIYTIKPLYDNIAYYMNLLMIDLFNMYKINSKGLSVAQDGWKQTNIEFKGYSSKYEKANNTLDSSQLESEKIDVDGPWVYSSLIEFIRLYNEDNISTLSIEEYIKKYYFELNEIQKQTLKTQLLNFSQKIINKQNYKIYDYQTDIYNNQYVLFKHKDYMKYEDAGQIWIRIKNHPLSIPLMNKNINVIINEDSVIDTIHVNDNNYDNMYKQLCNNAVQFGIKNNIIWILGYTNYYVNNNGNIFSSSSNTLYLRLVCSKFTFNQNTNKIIINSRDIRSFSNDDNFNSLENINQFIGVNYNSIKDSLDFVLFDMTNTKIVSENIELHNEDLENSKIYIKIFNYSLSDEENMNLSRNIKFENSTYPLLLKDMKVNVLKDPYIFEQDTFNNIGQTYHLRDAIYIPTNLSIQLEGTIYKTNKDEYSLIGKIFKKDEENNTIQILGSFEYKIRNIDFCNEKIEDYNLQPIYINGEIDNNKVTFNDIILNEDFKNTYIKNNYIEDENQNIWRLSQTQNQVSIAYEAVNWKAVKDAEILKEFNVEESIDNNFIGYLHYDAQLLTKSFLDHTGNLIFLNQIKNLSAIFKELPLNIENGEKITKDQMLLIQNKYPYCNLSRDNHLLVDVIPTTLGGNKNIYIKLDENDFSDPNGEQIISSLIGTSGEVYQNFINTIELSSIQRPYQNYANETKYTIHQLSTNIEKYRQILSDQLTGYINFYQYYEQYLKAKKDNLPITEQINRLNVYNNHMNELNNIIRFSSTLTDFIIEPMKILFSFGDFYNENYQLMGSEYFDLDVNVYLDTLEQRNYRVGWKCGRYKSEYLNWISHDQRFGGPEITLVDINKFIMDNQVKIIRGQITELNIIVNACWFIESQIQTQNPNIIINWKGFTYHYIVEDINVNEGCCDYPFIQINIDLESNAITCSKSVYLPAILTKKNDSQIYIGFIRKYERYLKDFFNNEDIKTISNENYTLQILNHSISTYDKLHDMLLNDSTFLENFGISTGISLKDKNYLEFDQDIQIDNDIDNIQYYNKFILI